MHKQQLECEETSRAERYAHEADTLLANLAHLHKGMSSCELSDVHSSLPLEIRLNPRLTPRENAQLLYKKARKGRRGAEIARKHLETTVQELDELQQIENELTSTLHAQQRPLTDATTERIATRLTSLGIRQGKKTPVSAEDDVPYRRYLLEGWTIYIGRTSTQNDELTTRFAKPWDIWLHVGQHAGSHVIIRRQKNAPWPPSCIMEGAAALAGWFSKARHASYVEVHVTEKRYVYKRRKSPPGEVMLEQYKTFRVPPRSPQDLFKHGEQSP